MPKLTLDDGQEVDVPYTEEGENLVDVVSEGMPTVDVNYAPAGSSDAQSRVQKYQMGDLVEEPIAESLATPDVEAPQVGLEVEEETPGRLADLANQAYPAPEEESLLGKETIYPLEEE